MAIGISSFAYRWAIRAGQMDAFALLERACDAGARVVQICDNLPLDGLPEDRLADLARRAGQLGLTVEVGIKGSQPEHLRRNLDVARRLDAHLLRVVLTGPGWEPPIDEMVRILKAILPDLRPAGVTVGIENHFHLRPEELARLIEAVDDPLVGVCLDPLNSITQFVGVAETVETLAPWVVSVHAKDAVITRPGTGFYISGCPLGEGLVDIPAMLDAVRATGRRSNVLAECWMDRLDDEAGTLAQEETWVRRGVGYLRQMEVGSRE